MDRECLYPGHPDTCTPWHYLERDGGRRMVTRVLVKVWTYRHPQTTNGDLAVMLTLAAHTGPDTTVSLDYEALATKTIVVWRCWSWWRVAPGPPWSGARHHDPGRSGGWGMLSRHPAGQLPNGDWVPCAPAFPTPPLYDVVGHCATL
jgi:hypothetical protein